VLYAAAGSVLRALTEDGNALWTYALPDAGDAIVAGPLALHPPSRPQAQPFIYIGTQRGSFLAIEAQVSPQVTWHRLLTYSPSCLGVLIHLPGMRNLGG
jgi:hypothetical protein